MRKASEFRPHPFSTYILFSSVEILSAKDLKKKCIHCVARFKLQSRILNQSRVTWREADLSIVALVTDN